MSDYPEEQYNYDATQYYYPSPHAQEYYAEQQYYYQHYPQMYAPPHVSMMQQPAYSPPSDYHMQTSNYHQASQRPGGNRGGARGGRGRRQFNRAWTRGGGRRGTGRDQHREDLRAAGQDAATSLQVLDMTDEETASCQMGNNETTPQANERDSGNGAKEMKNVKSREKLKYSSRQYAGNRGARRGKVQKRSTDNSLTMLTTGETMQESDGSDNRKSGRGRRVQGGRPTQPRSNRQAPQRDPPKAGNKRETRMQGRGALAKQNEESQRGSLVEQLTNGSYECMVCCDRVKCEHAVWSCGQCFHVFHLHCIKKWARSPSAAIEGGSGGWRCPACQKVTPKVPNQYRCFCGQVKDPEWDHYETPHSCGQVCGKPREGDCPHKCNILCHPGPCPPCQANVIRSCDCGKSKETMRCGKSTSWQCKELCGKTLNCGQHECSQTCHQGPCQPCQQLLQQDCFCGKEVRELVCGSAESFLKSFSCQQTCNRLLECGAHNCSAACHPGMCEPCSLLPELVKTCPCGKSELDSLGAPTRKTCKDPVPTCGQPCLKELPCGPAEKRHQCQQLCHVGPCGSCDGNSLVLCRCRAYSKTVSCSQAAQYTEKEPLLCEKRCQKKRDCGRHKCGQQCCVDKEHHCEQVCGRKLTCGNHRCEELCHRGNCHTCWQVSFEELTCHCGAEVIFPPIPCGTPPPECQNLCQRNHSCSHPVTHSCHSEDSCPPCTVLTEKMCMGGHELRKNIACHLVDISCGLPCAKDLPCGMHKCQRLCHKGECMDGDSGCQQPCIAARSDCGHPCGVPCHVGKPCPQLACKTQVEVRCACGHRKKMVQCGSGYQEDFHKLATSMLATKVAGMQLGQDISLGELMPQSKAPLRLECSEECAIRERNLRVALALEIRNPELSNKLGTPSYSDFLKTMARQNLAFVSSVEKEFSTLVTQLQQGKLTKKSHAFPSMNYEQRKFVHELAEHYGCETQSYDQEPKKNVVATAYRGKCWLPSVTLTAHIQREVKPPMPIPHNSSEADIRQQAQAARQSTSVSGAWNQSSQKKERVEKREAIDYFDYTG